MRMGIKSISEEQRERLRVALLEYFLYPTILRNAIEDKTMDQYSRQAIKDMVFALRQIGYLQDFGPNTSGKMYRTTKIGREYLEKIKKA